MTDEEVLSAIVAEQGYFVIGSRFPRKLPCPFIPSRDHYPRIDCDQPFTVIAETDRADAEQQAKRLEQYLDPDGMTNFDPYSYFYRAVTD